LKTELVRTKFGVFEPKDALVRLPRVNLLILRTSPFETSNENFMVKPPLRTKSIGTKVTEEEYAKLELTAQAGGKTLGEWCREVMLASANAQVPKSQLSDGGEALVLVAEFAALRTILLNVLFRQANGETLTPEQMQTLIDRADANKLKKGAEWRGRARFGRGPDRNFRRKILAAQSAPTVLPISWGYYILSDGSE
jgi:hypothetical protein